MSQVVGRKASHCRLGSISVTTEDTKVHKGDRVKKLPLCTLVFFVVIELDVLTGQGIHANASLSRT